MGLHLHARSVAFDLQRLQQLSASKTINARASDVMARPAAALCPAQTLDR